VVLTLAAGAGCSKETQRTNNPPPPEPKPKPREPRWYVSGSPGGSPGEKCSANELLACPPPQNGVAMSCNPPPPVAYDCPKDVALPAQVFQSGDTCTVEVAGTSPVTVPCPAYPGAR